MRMIWLCVSSHWPLRLFGLKGLLARASGVAPAVAGGDPAEAGACASEAGGVGLAAVGEAKVLLARLGSAVGKSEGNTDVLVGD